MASKYVCLVAGVVVFGLGFSLAYWRGEAKIQTLKVNYETSAKEAKATYVKKLEAEREQRARDVSALLEQIKQAHDRERSLTTRVDRMRINLDRIARNAEGKATNSSADAKRLGQCARLLNEGVSLVNEGLGLVERISIKKDGLANQLR